MDYEMEEERPLTYEDIRRVIEWMKKPLSGVIYFDIDHSTGQKYFFHEGAWHEVKPL